MCLQPDMMQEQGQRLAADEHEMRSMARSKVCMTL